MAKFAVLGLFAILALVQYAEGINMPSCAQLALSHGVPSLGIPNHNPLRIRENFTIHLENFVGNEFTFVIDHIVWQNLPWWRVLKDTEIKNTTDATGVEAILWWDNFTISFDYKYQWGWQNLDGNIALHFEDVTWTAEWEETKPDAAGVKKIKYLNVDQKIGKRSVSTTGFGLLSFIADNILLAILDLGNEVFINGRNGIGSIAINKVNDKWYKKPEVTNALVDWCKSQNVTAAYH